MTSPAYMSVQLVGSGWFQVIVSMARMKGSGEEEAKSLMTSALIFDFAFAFCFLRMIFIVQIGGQCCVTIVSDVKIFASGNSI
ncbi:hypothetical protein Y032_0298g1752 [Ancylostoma ceylanicum]|uniref:Uncharacterized protein n=1 Tax=Ancylostoma ceylanicum TaxID=53326 RepID=A0A016S447_9BILA|nr:hypothetical protein Y032_0298g1752 [Ancylostoma ceylanicum]